MYKPLVPEIIILRVIQRLHFVNVKKKCIKWLIIQVNANTTIAPYTKPTEVIQTKKAHEFNYQETIRKPVLKDTCILIE